MIFVARQDLFNTKNISVAQLFFIKVLKINVSWRLNRKENKVMQISKKSQTFFLTENTDLYDVDK